ncbi:hypothetical protein ACIBQ5_33705 [Streptomyces massasporeus]|uniref:hypothetical protein n=1 Tax=Streptomyces massasporeus TaxID=67324 RepID=UPI0037A09C07
MDAVVGFFDFLGDPIGTIIEGIANAVLAGAISIFGDLTTSIPTLVADGSAQQVSTQTQWIVVYTAVGSLIFAAIRMAIERRGEAGAVALKGLLRVILVAGAATAVTTALASLSDRYADHLFAAGAQRQLTSIGCDDGDGITSFLLLILAFLLIIAGIVQTVLLYIRLGVMILLLGTLPLAAAASMTDWGSGWWRKHIGWMIAWLLYKPAAALVMFAGSAMIKSGPDSGIQEKIAGIGVMLLSALALPALLKLVVPATAALGGARAAQSGTTAAAGAVASGARSLGSTALSAVAGGARGAAGPTGAPAVSGGTGGTGAAAASGRPAEGPRPAGRGNGLPTTAAGAAGAALGAAATTTRAAGQMAARAIDGADGDVGHNR